MKLLFIVFLAGTIFPMEKDIEIGINPGRLSIALPCQKRSSIVIFEEQNEEQICRLAFQSFSVDESPQTSRIKDFLCHHIRMTLDAPNTPDRESLKAIGSFQGQNLEDEYLKKYLQKLFLRATTDALATAETEVVKNKEDAAARVSKTRATYYAMASSTVTAAIGIGVTLLMHYTG